jgi:epoxyqueuosine reductase
MLSRNEVIDHALHLGFADIGFTSAQPFEFQKEILESRREGYALYLGQIRDLLKGTEPKELYADARSIIVLIGIYFEPAFPAEMEAKFGRFYLYDDRIIQKGLYMQLTQFRNYLSENGIHSEISPHLSDRLSSARAGLGTFGKNSLLYSTRVARQSSWITPIAMMVDREFEPDDPTLVVGCPEWCKNACIAACPTGALKGPRHLDPRKCVSYLTYRDPGITDRDLREPMGVRVYGCDHCQSVCPRNAPWMAVEKPSNAQMDAMQRDFELTKLLHMDKTYFETRIWPYMFYMPYDDIWRWKMNVARAMGNSGDSSYVPTLIRAFEEVEDERTRGMIAWALGRLGGSKAKAALESSFTNSQGLLRKEIQWALDQ